MGKVVEFKDNKVPSRPATKEELKKLFEIHTDLKGHLGKEFHIQYDNRTKDFWVVGPDDIDMILDLFLAISRKRWR